MKEQKTAKYELLQRTGVNENTLIGKTSRKVGFNLKPNKNSGTRKSNNSGCSGCSRNKRK
jgi:hypothetical protein